MSEYSHVVEEAEATVDHDIDRYARMPLDEVNRQLDKHGINAEKTVTEVLKLVEGSRQEQRAKRGR